MIINNQQKNALRINGTDGNQLRYSVLTTTKNYQPAGRISFFCPVRHRQAQLHPRLRHVPSLWTTDRETGSCQATATSPIALCRAATTILRDRVHDLRETLPFSSGRMPGLVVVNTDTLIVMKLLIG